MYIDNILYMKWSLCSNIKRYYIKGIILLNGFEFEN